MRNSTLITWAVTLFVLSAIAGIVVFIVSPAFSDPAQTFMFRSGRAFGAWLVVWGVSSCIVFTGMAIKAVINELFWR